VLVSTIVPALAVKFIKVEFGLIVSIDNEAFTGHALPAVEIPYHSCGVQIACLGDVTLAG